ncbi:putative methyltransferase [Tolypocladium ophioglossoides CBS 100239]|uniref:Putative methyltransferase n=1 Tax=Tolypocladium ophioglossoides (strain CBS 100239) TaxID=1163406 RepID=A0A0L0N7M3_TOLOC|nr:putative methyltransferase [Tolypocladium ophioglossoides CBS 100239]
MSYHERQSKKRKTAHNGPQERQDRTSFKPSAIFNPIEGGRDWTVSVAIPSSILTNLATADQRMAAPGRIARALAVFSVDEVVVFDDSPVSSRPRHTDPAAYTGDTDPCHFMAHILSFLESPPFMRKVLFPLHPNLRLTALLPSLDMPHHPNPKEWIPYREGVTVAGKTSTGKGTLVEVGMEEPVEIEEQIPPKTRLTLLFPEDQSQYPECVDPAAPRSEGGYYWGYTVRKAPSLSSVFTESPYENGYDISVGTSERGTPLSKAFPSSKPLDFKHMLIVFGGPRGLEFASMNDEELNGMAVQGSKTKELFDHWVNVLPNQGSRTIRTEEALFIALTAMRGLWDSS